MLSIIAPVYNEADNLPLLYQRVSAVIRSLDQEWELLLINDGSRDASADILDRLAEQDPAVKIVHFKRNFGQTVAMMAGIDYASGDIIIPMHSFTYKSIKSNEINLSFNQNFVDFIGKFGLVGNRMHSDGC